jgi:hypothetical protein
VRLTVICLVASALLTLGYTAREVPVIQITKEDSSIKFHVKGISGD